MVCWKQLNWGKTSTESWEFHIIKIIYIVDLVSFQSLRRFLFINLHSVWYTEAEEHEKPEHKQKNKKWGSPGNEAIVDSQNCW